MKSKTFFILLVTCAVLAVVSWFVLKPGTPSARKKTDTAGVRLLADLPVNDILRIDIAGPDSGVVMEKGEAVWVVKDKFGYPADFPKLTSLVLKLRDMKIDRTFPASEDILDRLSLRRPDAPPKNAVRENRGNKDHPERPGRQTGGRHHHRKGPGDRCRTGRKFCDARRGEYGLCRRSGIQLP